MLGRCVAVLLLLPALAGCSEAGGGAVLPELVWAPSYSIVTTPLEPFELQGTNVVQRDGEVRGLFVENEDDMARQHIWAAGTWYATVHGRGWTRFSDQAALDGASGRAHRLQTWDPQGLVEAATEVEVVEDRLVTQTLVTANGQSHQVTVTATLQGGFVVAALIQSPFDPESPYTATPGGVLPFPLRVPTDVLNAADAKAGDDAARAAHVRIIGWIEAHRSQTGSLPESVDAQSLTVQRLGTAWPDNVFAGGPMRHADDSGHFLWHYCGPQDAVYEGLGWDLSPVGESFGRGCAGSSEGKHQTAW